nr:DnaD domain protein [bacterium]
DYVKVYLYLLKMAHYPEPEAPSLEGLARLLDLDAAVVEDALEYWQRRGLISREEGQGFSLLPVSAALIDGGKNASLIEQQTTRFRELNRSLQELFGKRLLTPSDYARVQDWVDGQGVTDEAVLAAARYSIHKARSGLRVSFAFIERVLMDWQGRGLTQARMDALADRAERGEGGAVAVLRQLGETGRSPSVEEDKLYDKWTGEWGFDEAAILAACAQTTSARTPSFAYLDRVLESLHHKGAVTEPKARRQAGRDAALRRLSADVQQALGLVGGVSAPLQELCRQALDEGVEPGALVCAAREAAGRGGSLHALERQVQQLLRQGLTQEEAVRAHYAQRSQLEKGLAQVLDVLGIEGRVPGEFVSAYALWIKEGYTQEVVLLAAARALRANAPLPYMKRVLAAWKEEGLTTPQAILDEQARRAPKDTATGRKMSAALSYAQRTYSREQLDARFTEI